MAPHSSTLAWKIPWTGAPSGLQSMGSLRVRHDWATSLWLFTFMHWRRKWQPTPVFLPGESQGRGSLVAAVYGVTQSRTRLSDFTFTIHFHALEKEMATHSSILAWRTPGTGEPGGLPSTGSHRVRHDWSDLTAAAAATYNLWIFNFFLIRLVTVEFPKYFSRWNQSDSLNTMFRWLWILSRPGLGQTSPLWKD